MSQSTRELFTFLFTDIEGSTRLWEKHYEAMRIALNRHDGLLREAITAHAGHAFKTVGDAFYAAFPTAMDALHAALMAQHALLTEPWGATPLKVRMALVTGPAEARDDDYFGPPLNRAARLLGIGHGSQILLAHSTQEAVAPHLPAGVSLHYLGQHHLKGLEEPEQVFQLLGPHLPTEFPPLRSLSTHPTNLPASPTSFIQRTEVAAVCAALDNPAVRLLTLTGPGGTGKSRLGLEVATRLVPRFPDGVFWIPLAPIRDPMLVVPALAEALNVQETSSQGLLERLKSYLRPKQLLLLLDNFEQILDAAPIISELLSSAPHLKVLVTSREILYLYGEQEFAVPPLTLPNGAGNSIEAILTSEAGQLFLDRVRALNPGFALTLENGSLIATLCHHLDGLPLAIELAAARMRSLSLEQMTGQLTNRLHLLASGPRDLPARQQTLRGAISWSHELLSEEEQTLFRRLAAFVGGCTQESVVALYALEISDFLVGGLESLASKSLLELRQDERGARFHMLETIREFATEQLQTSGEEQAIRRQHAHHFCTLVEETIPSLAGDSSAASFARLEQEYANIRAALTWSLTAQDGELELGGRMVGVLGPFWIAKAHLTEGRRWLEMALAKSAQLPEAVRAQVLLTAGEMEDLERDGTMARAERLLLDSLALYTQLAHARGMAQTLFALGHIYRRQDQLQRAIETYQQALEGYRNANDTWGEARTLKELGRIARAQNNFDQTESYYEQSAQLFQQLGDKAELSHLYQLLGENHFFNRHDYTLALAYYQRGLTLARAIQHRYRTLTLLNDLGELARFRQDYPQALRYLEEGLQLAREEGTKSIAALLANRGYLALHQGEAREALEYFQQSLAISLNSGIRRFMMYSLLAFAVAAATFKEYERATRLLALVEQLRSEMQQALEPPDRAEYERALALTRAKLTPTEFEATWASGQAMTIEEAVAEARAILPPPS